MSGGVKKILDLLLWPMNQRWNCREYFQYDIWKEKVANRTVSSGEDDTLLSSISSALPRHNPILNEALAYLDRVKSTYPEEPMMYNMFLDIMKHFKIGKLDTPGVINSIVGLFGEETALINEFNMFLPPGYKLETNPHSDACIVRVTIPDGTILTSLAGGKRKQRDELDKGGSDGIDDAFASTEQHKPRPKKRRRLRQASDRF